MVPILIFYVLWKMRNIILHGTTYLERKVILEINHIIIRFVKLGFEIEIVERNRSNVVDELQVHNN